MFTNRGDARGRPPCRCATGGVWLLERRVWTIRSAPHVREHCSHPAVSVRRVEADRRARDGRAVLFQSLRSAPKTDSVYAGVIPLLTGALTRGEAPTIHGEAGEELQRLRGWRGSLVELFEAFGAAN